MEKKKTLILLKSYLSASLTALVAQVYPDAKFQPHLQSQMRQQYDFTSPGLIKMFNQNKVSKNYPQKTIQQMGLKIKDSFIKLGCTGIKQLNLNDKGFLQIHMTNQLIQEQNNNALKHGLNYPLQKKQLISIDFPSPNIAKQLHVGHLRSAIIGESISRLLQFIGHQVKRFNHIGDWGTQFGMLIEYLKLNYPNYLQQMPEIKDLDLFYKQSKAKFESDENFKKMAQLRVVDLQKYGQQSIYAWKVICQISRKLEIRSQECGQSFYNQMIPQIINNLKEKSVVQESKGAQCIFIKNIPQPLIVIKKDGGFGYDSTDIAAIKYRLVDLQSSRLIYVTDSGQAQHFQLITKAAQRAGWKKQQRVDHMGFGLVVGADGKKFSTSKIDGSAVKLIDLLDEAKQKALVQIKQRAKQGQQKKQKQMKKQKQKQLQKQPQQQQVVFTTGTNLTQEQYEIAAEKLGMAAIKYFDLRQNRKSNYQFNYKKMLDPKGNTAVYLIYAYVRLCSIIRKSNLSPEALQKLIQTSQFKISHPDQRKLAANLIKFADVINQTSQELALNKYIFLIRLTDFIFQICTKIQENYKKYRIIGSEQMQSRILLCQGARRVLQKSFYLIGIVPLQKI